MTAQVALVTGAGSGIGRATALLLAERGYELCLVGRRPERLEETAAQARARRANVVIQVLAADCSKWDEAQGAVAQCVQRFGRLDVLVNNAGAAPTATIADTTGPMANEVFAINAIGPMAMIVAAWPTFVKQRGGCVVNVSSMATIDPFPSLFAYAAAKASLNVMCKSIVNQAKADGMPGIRAYAIAPGAVETEMLRGVVSEQMLPRSKTLTPERVAELICESAAGDHVDQNGETIPLPGPE